MTTHYVDIRILPDPEFREVHLLGALYAKLHRALVFLGVNNIGVSFPQYSMQPRSLGGLMRLHGSEAALQHLLQTDWLRGMRDHIEISVVLVRPEEVQYRRLQRRQFKTNVERLRRRRMRRKNESREQAIVAIPDGVEQSPNLPYVQLRSGSTGHPFCLFLELSNSLPVEEAGVFNTYGLSVRATVPWF